MSNPYTPHDANLQNPLPVNVHPMERVFFNLNHQLCTFVCAYTTNRIRSLLEKLWLVIAVCGFGALLLVHFTFVHRALLSTEAETSIPSNCLPSMPGFNPHADITHLYLFDSPQIPTPPQSIVEQQQKQQQQERLQKETRPSKLLPRTSWAYTESQQRNRETLSTATTLTKASAEPAPPLSSDAVAGNICQTNDPNVTGAGSEETCTTTTTTNVSQEEENLHKEQEQHLPHHHHHRYVVELSYSRVKGYLLLPDTVVHPDHISVQHVFVSKQDHKCFGEPFLQHMIFRLGVGPETVMTNWFLSLHDSLSLGLFDKDNTNRKGHLMNEHHEYSPGYVYNPYTDLLLALRPVLGTSPSSTASRSTASRQQQRRTHHHHPHKLYYHDDGHERQRNDSSISSYYGKLAGSKLSVLLKTCFLYFVTTTLVSFTLRETQERMLDFTQQLQNHVRNRRPVVHLVTKHCFDSLVFVPIMVGIVFFMIEFYNGDKILAFWFMSIVWLYEAFSVISVRSFPGIHFFPKIFFLLFALCHFYIFSFPFGFSYVATLATFCFMMHSMVFFWYRFELPAMLLGQVSLANPRIYYRSMAANSRAFSNFNAQQQLQQEQQQLNDQHRVPSTVFGGPNGFPSHDSSMGMAPSDPNLAFAAAMSDSVSLSHTPPQQLYPSSSSNSHSMRAVPSPRISQRPSRHSLQRSLSQTSSHADRIMSRDASSNALFNHGDDDSYMYFMGGEVVMHQRDAVMHQHQRAAFSAHQGLSPAFGSNSSLHRLSQQQQQQQPHHPSPHIVHPIGFDPHVNLGEHARTRTGAVAIPDRVLAEVGVGGSPNDVVYMDDLTRGSGALHRAQNGIPLPTDAGHDPSRYLSAVAEQHRQQQQQLQHAHTIPRTALDANDATMRDSFRAKKKKHQREPEVLESNGGLPSVVLDDDDTTDQEDDAGTEDGDDKRKNEPAIPSNNDRTPKMDNRESRIEHRENSAVIQPGDPLMMKAPRLPNNPLGSARSEN